MLQSPVLLGEPSKVGDRRDGDKVKSRSRVAVSYWSFVRKWNDNIDHMLQIRQNLDELREAIDDEGNVAESGSEYNPFSGTESESDSSGDNKQGDLDTSDDEVHDRTRSNNTNKKSVYSLRVKRGSPPKVKRRGGPVQRVDPVRYRCSICDYVAVHRRDLLIKHLLKYHKVPENDRALRVARALPGRRREMCRHCRRAYGNLHQHIPRCKVLKKKKARQAARREKLARRHAAEWMGTTWEVSADADGYRETGLEEVLEKYHRYLVVHRKMTSEGARGYYHQLRRFLEYVEIKDSKFAAAQLMVFGEDGEEPLLLPASHIHVYVDQELSHSPTSAQGCLKALTAFVGFLTLRKMELVNQVSEAHLQRVQSNLSDLRETIALKRKGLQQSTNEKFLARRRSKQETGSLGTRPRAMRNYLRRFATSGKLTETIAGLCKSGEELLEKRLVTPSRFRDVALAVLLVASGGQRPMALLNATLEDWERGRELGEGRFIFEIPRHKTSGKYGPLKVPLVRAEVVQLLSSYVRVARPLLLGGRELAESKKLPLFVSSRSPFRLKKVEGAIAVIKEVLVAEGVNDPALKKLTAGDLRKAYADLGAKSSDTGLSSNMPEFMAHSREVRDGHYLTEDNTGLMVHCANKVSEMLEEEEEPEEEELQLPKHNSGEGGEEEEDLPQVVSGQKRNFNLKEVALLVRLFVPEEGGGPKISNAVVAAAREKEHAFEDIWRRLTETEERSPRQAIQTIRSAIKRKR